MSIKGIRFRMEGELCVLQVEEYEYTKGYSYPGEEKRTWRDAKATDLLIVAAFTSSPEDLDKRVSYLQECVSRLETTVLRNPVPERQEFEQHPLRNQF